MVPGMHLVVNGKITLKCNLWKSSVSTFGRTVKAVTYAIIRSEFESSMAHQVMGCMVTVTHLF